MHMVTHCFGLNQSKRLAKRYKIYTTLLVAALQPVSPAGARAGPCARAAAAQGRM